MKSFTDYLKEPDVVDIVTVDEVSYAIVTQSRSIPGCLSLTAAQLPTRIREFLARGYSHRHRKSYSATSGVFAWSLFTYSLEKLAPVHKQTFSHALMGVATKVARGKELEKTKEEKEGSVGLGRNTGGKNGLLSKWRGEKLGRGAFIVPLDRESEATAFLDRWGITYTREVVLRDR